MKHSEAHYKSRIARKIFAFILSLLLMTVGVFPAANHSASAETNGMIRVKLTRLGTNVSSVTMKTVGGYTSSGTAISNGSTVKVAKSGSSLVLTVNGTQITTGPKIILNRTSSGTGCGVQFTSPSLSNLFCGDLTFTLSGGVIQTVLTIYIETYLYGVVPYEMSNSFPIEALKAQTIAARTYALRAKRSSGSYDVTDNTSSQVFKGYNSSYKNAISAVDDTHGVVLMSGSSYAQCYYTASNGGQTESSSNAWGSSGISYLTVKDDPYDRENPNSIVKSHNISKNPSKKSLHSGLQSALIAAAADQLKAKGLSTDASDVTISEIIDVEPHTPKYDTPSRTYTKLRFTMKLTSRSASTGNRVSTQVEVDLNTYSKLQSMLSLSINSADNEIVSVEEDDDSFKLSFARYGHGIGMSQRGAQWMAKQYGMSYEDILSFYYPGTKQTKLSLRETVGGSGSSVESTPTRAPVQTEGEYTTLQEGDSGDSVKALQSRLKELGYFTGTPLGNYKTLTISAVKAYQTAMGLKADGIATPALQKMIFSEQETPDSNPDENSRTAKIVLQNASSRMNVRKSASTSSTVVGTLKHGSEVKVLGSSGEWSQIRTDSLSGYVKTSYLRFEDESVPAPTASPTPAPDTDAGNYKTLQYGDSGEEVRNLQKQLQKLGFFNGTPLGNYKSQTTSAVQAYQTAMGLKADGVATPELQKMIFAGKLPEPGESVSATISLGNTNSRLNVRSQPNTTSAVVTTVRHGVQVEVLTSSGDWSNILCNGYNGYVKTSYLVFASGSAPEESLPESTPEPAAGTAVISLSSSSSKLNVRKSATTASAIQGTLRHGTQVEVLERGSDWSQIRSGSLIGYVKTSYLSFGGESADQPEDDSDSNTRTAYIKLNDTSAKLNVRSQASTSSSVVGKLSHGSQVQVTGETGSWSRIRHGSLSGYVMTSYLSDSASSEKEEPSSTPSAPSSSKYVSLSYGDSGASVKKLQTRLRELGYFSGELGGNYLKLTEAAVEAYQQANGWPVNGVASAELQEEIFREDNPSSANASVAIDTNSFLNLRASADSASQATARLRNGARLYVISEEGSWYKVRTSDGLTGYVKASYVDKD